MESLINRYRNLTILLLVLVGQLLLLAYQVRSQQDVRLIRVWAVTAVMPLARVLESIRSNTFGFFRQYSKLIGAEAENQRLKKELGSLKLENQFLKTELATADRAQALAAFQSRSPSRMIAARIIGTGTEANSKAVFLDRGANAGVRKGNAVVTPDGIVGKVVLVYPATSLVTLVTDPGFRAGVISHHGRVHGTLKGQGHAICQVDYIQNEDKVVEGEWFYTSGEDRVFPKGMPVGQVRSARPGRVFQDINLLPSGLLHGVEEVLIVIEGVHQPLPGSAEAQQDLHMLPAPPDEPSAQNETTGGRLSTDADMLVERYRRQGEAQGIRFGDNPALATPPAQAPATQAPVAPAAQAPKPPS